MHINLSVYSIKESDTNGHETTKMDLIHQQTKIGQLSSTRLDSSGIRCLLCEDLLNALRRVQHRYAGTNLTERFALGRNKENWPSDSLLCEISVRT